MSDSRVNRRGFLTMLGVLVGAGAAGGMAWLRSVEGASSVTTGGSVPAGATFSMTTQPPSPTTASVPTTTSTSPLPSASMEVICKEAWGGAAVQGEFVGQEIERLTVHHTAVLMGSNTEAPRRMRSYQRYHQEQGWPDIAYHYLIDADGNIYEGRPVAARGDTFTEYDPSGHLLVCCDGHFDQQGVPEAQVAALVDVLAWAAIVFGVDPSTIAGHGDYASTTCPGWSLASFIADGTLRTNVEEHINGGGVSLALLCGPAGRERVADIEAGVR